MEAKWIKYKDQQPEDNRLFIVREIGTELNTNWKIKVWNKELIERQCGIHNKKVTILEYLYIS